jgi:hypothetical protein
MHQDLLTIKNEMLSSMKRSELRKTLKNLRTHEEQAKLLHGLLIYVYGIIRSFSRWSVKLLPAALLMEAKNSRRSSAEYSYNTMQLLLLLIMNQNARTILPTWKLRLFVRDEGGSCCINDLVEIEHCHRRGTSHRYWTL